MIDLGWVASAAPIVLGAGVGLVARRVIAANDERRAQHAELPAPRQVPPSAGAPKAGKTLRHAVPAGHR
jgi:hypothetical protein